MENFQQSHLNPTVFTSTDGKGNSNLQENYWLLHPNYPYVSTQMYDTVKYVFPNGQCVTPNTRGKFNIDIY